ncbi:UNVERIFIED_CONTAM: hypothetical protein RKD43_006393 [Streptomyces graminofaciens]
MTAPHDGAPHDEAAPKDMSAPPDEAAAKRGARNDGGRTMNGTSNGTGTPDRELLPIATGAQTLAVVRTLLRGHRLLTVSAVTVLVLGTGIGMLTAPLLGRIVDLVVAQRGPGALTVPMVLLLTVATARGVATRRRQLARRPPRGDRAREPA